MQSPTIWLISLLLAAFEVWSDERPNILLIVADDLGYSDLGVFGGDISTPNIDALAARGLLFTQFHTAPLCAPTRAMLLSGNNNHVAGMATQFVTAPVAGRVPGYEGHLSDRIVPLPRLLSEAGYHTYTVGKWHLGKSREHSPWAAGFERSFNLVDGAGSHWDDTGFTAGGSTYRQDGEEVEYPNGRYSTELYTDRLIEFIDSNRRDDVPFFAFAAYTSPHWPLQVPEAEMDLYRNQYDAGYDKLRESRFESLRKAGIIPSTSKIPARYAKITPWEDLSDEQKRSESRKMELYAAMVHNLDRHVGRLITYLKNNDLYDNTLIVFMSDNGAAAEDFYNDDHRPYKAYIREHYDNSYDNMGKPGSFVSYGPQWAEAGSAAFRLHKGFATEGGMVAPMIIAGSGVAHRGVKTSAFTTVMDLMPTFLELAGATYPSDPKLVPIAGESMVGLLNNTSKQVHDQTYTTLLSHSGDAFIRQGEWKLTHVGRPFSEKGFALYNVTSDPGETTDLRDREPDHYSRMIALWRSERLRLGIILPDDL